jgi:hypothetical protein
MTTTTANKSARTIVASASNAAGATTRGTLDLRTAHGATVTVKLTNGATGPTVPCTCNILIAHDGGATPTAASAGAVWKTLWSFAGLTTNNGVFEQSIAIDASVMHLCVEFTANTAQAVTVEAFASETTSYTSA